MDWAWRTNRIVSAQSRCYPMWFLVVGLDQWGRLPIKTNNTGWSEQQIRDNLATVLLDLIRKNARVFFPGWKVCAKYWGLCWTLTLNDRVRSFKMCNYGSNRAFRLGHMCLPCSHCVTNTLADWSPALTVCANYCNTLYDPVHSAHTVCCVLHDSHKKYQLLPWSVLTGQPL